MTNLGREIRNIRKSMHLTQEALSAASGVNAATISAYETERYIPNTQTVALLLDAMGCELEIRRKTH